MEDKENKIQNITTPKFSTKINKRLSSEFISESNSDDEVSVANNFSIKYSQNAFLSKYYDDDSSDKSMQEDCEDQNDIFNK